MTKRNFLYIALWLSFWLGPACFGQSITIRVMNMDTGRPLQNRPVHIVWFYTKDEPRPANLENHLNLETGSSGEAQFQLPEPAPSYFVAEVTLASDYWHCACNGQFVTKDVLGNGIMRLAGPKLSSAIKDAKAEPGVMLFFARPFNFFERLIAPLERG
jgi:hypothetical protein